MNLFHHCGPASDQVQRPAWPRICLERTALHAVKVLPSGSWFLLSAREPNILESQPNPTNIGKQKPGSCRDPQYLKMRFACTVPCSKIFGPENGQRSVSRLNFSRDDVRVCAGQGIPIEEPAQVGRNSRTWTNG
jgi:hypothetical protein